MKKILKKKIKWGVRLLPCCLFVDSLELHSKKMMKLKDKKKISNILLQPLVLKFFYLKEKCLCLCRILKENS